MFGRLIANWVYGGFVAGLLLLLLTPVLVHSWPAPLVATFLCLPVYMIHQYEEHDNDRFRLFVNQKIGKGRVGLSPSGCVRHQRARGVGHGRDISGIGSEG